MSLSTKLYLGPVLTSAACFVVACLPGHAFAQDASVQSEASSRWGLGIAAAMTQKPYRDIESKTTGLPLISYEGRWASVALPRADLKLYSGDSISLRLRARFASDGYDASDSPFLIGMQDRKASLWLGGAGILRTDMATFTGELLADAMGNSKGKRLKLQVDRRFATGSFGFTPRLAAEWLDSKYVDYYYGVRAEEAQASRALDALCERLGAVAPEAARFALLLPGPEAESLGNALRESVDSMGHAFERIAGEVLAHSVGGVAPLAAPQTHLHM